MTMTTKTSDELSSVSSKEVLRLRKLCSEQNDKDAQYELGKIYEFGIGVKEDKKEANRLYRLSAEQGNKNAEYKLSTPYELEKKKGIKFYISTFEKDNNNTQYDLAIRCKYSTVPGEPKYELKCECSLTKNLMDVTYKRETIESYEYWNEDRECNSNDIIFRYSGDSASVSGDLAAYGIPDEIFESKTLSKKHNLLVMFNEYVKEFGNIRGERLENYFNASPTNECNYSNGGFTIDDYLDESSIIEVVNHDKMKIFIEMFKTVFDGFTRFREIMTQKISF